MDENEKIWGLYDDDGMKINPDLIVKPSLCVTCRKDGMGGEEELLCLLNRHDQQGEKEFKCYAYESK